MKVLKLLFPAAILFLFISCFGISTNIVINQNGSGTISIEYRISNTLDSIGRLDGNQRWNTIPVGRADFERTVSRLNDIRLLSFNTREDANDVYFSLRLEFSSIQGLLSFMDAYGQMSIFNEVNNVKTLTFILNEGSDINNPSLEQLLSRISDGYEISYIINFPGEGRLSIKDRTGNIIAPLSNGRSASASFSLYDVLTSRSGLNLEFSWQ